MDRAFEGKDIVIGSSFIESSPSFEKNVSARQKQYGAEWQTFDPQTARDHHEQ